MVGTSADKLLVALLVREDMEDMEESVVWVLCGGRDVENVSVLRSGSKGELDGEGEGVWTEIGNVPPVKVDVAPDRRNHDKDK